MRRWSQAEWVAHGSPSESFRAFLPDWTVVVDGHATGLVAGYVLHREGRWLLMPHPLSHDPAKKNVVQPDAHAWWDKQTWRQRRDWCHRSLLVSQEWLSLVDMATDVARFSTAWSNSSQARFAVAVALRRNPEQRAALEMLDALSPTGGIKSLLSLGS